MRRSGFTILELIAVIGIVAVIGTAVVGAFSGMMKSVSRRTAADSVRRALNLARQEACVDGNDVYFYAVDVSRYAIVRKAGTISSVSTASRTIDGRTVDLGNGGKWILDDFADLSDSTESFVAAYSDDAQTEDEAVLAAFKDYAGSMVFDMEDGVYADIAWPAYRDLNVDKWVFGIKNPKDADGNDVNVVRSHFLADHDYGWVTHPIQSLPQGYVLKGTYEESTGKFKPGNTVRVHFNADGALDSGTEITIERPDDGTEIKIRVSAAGKITEESVQ